MMEDFLCSMSTAVKISNKIVSRRKGDNMNPAIFTENTEAPISDVTIDK